MAYVRDDIRAVIEAQEKAERDHASNLAAAVRKERERAEEAERERDAERQRAEHLAARLRELGVEPE